MRATEARSRSVVLLLLRIHRFRLKCSHLFFGSVCALDQPMHAQEDDPQREAVQGDPKVAFRAPFPGQESRALVGRRVVRRFHQGERGTGGGGQGRGGDEEHHLSQREGLQDAHGEDRVHELGDGMSPAPGWHALVPTIRQFSSLSNRAFLRILRVSRSPRQWRKHQHQHHQRHGKRGVHVHLPCRRHRRPRHTCVPRALSPSLSHHPSLTIPLSPSLSFTISLSPSLSFTISLSPSL